MNHRSRAIAIVASLTLFATAYGCSSSSSGDDSSATPDGGGAGSEGGSSGGDGGGGSGGDGGGGGGGGKEYQGAVTLSTQIAIAQFQKTSTASTSCVTTSGSCKLYNCPIDNDAGDVPTYGAGDITITGGSLASPLVLAYDSDAGVYSKTLASAPFAAGNTLSIGAAGGDVSAFSGSAGPAPSAITLTAPTGTGTPGFQEYDIDTSKDLTVTWTGGTAGSQVHVTLSNVDDENTLLELQCSFDAAAGTATLPTALLAQLNDPSSGVFEVTAVSQTNASGSNVDVLLQLVAPSGITGTWTKQ